MNIDENDVVRFDDAEQVRYSMTLFIQQATEQQAELKRVLALRLTQQEAINRKLDGMIARW